MGPSTPAARRSSGKTDATRAAVIGESIKREQRCAGLDCCLRACPSSGLLHRLSVSCQHLTRAVAAPGHSSSSCANRTRSSPQCCQSPPAAREGSAQLAPSRRPAAAAGRPQRRPQARRGLHMPCRGACGRPSTLATYPPLASRSAAPSARTTRGTRMRHAAAQHSLTLAPPAPHASTPACLRSRRGPNYRPSVMQLAALWRMMCPSAEACMGGAGRCCTYAHTSRAGGGTTAAAMRSRTTTPRW